MDGHDHGLPDPVEDGSSRGVLYGGDQAVLNQGLRRSHATVAATIDFGCLATVERAGKAPGPVGVLDAAQRAASSNTLAELADALNADRRWVMIQRGPYHSRSLAHLPLTVVAH